MSSSSPRIVKLLRGKARGRGRVSIPRHTTSSNHSNHHSNHHSNINTQNPNHTILSEKSVYITNTLRRGRGRGRGRGHGRARGSVRGRGRILTNSSNKPSTPIPNIRGRGRGRARGNKSIIKTIPFTTTNINNNNNNNNNNSTIKLIDSHSSHFIGNTEMKEWQKTPCILLREWCH
eukprot:175895_1